jgi:DNA-binding PadR family transcriptional regulator
MAMAPKKSGIPTKRRPLREWIKDALGESGPLTTTKLRKKVTEKTGAKYHMNSMYLALRSLKKSGTVSATGKGRQRFYALARKVEGAAAKAKVSVETAAEEARASIGAAARKAETSVASRVRAAKAPAPAAAPAAPAATSGPALPHRLAMGEIAIVDVDKDTVLSATNVHGELVLKRHPVPSK